MHTPDDHEFFLYTRDVWPAMLAAIRGAEKSIDLEQFIFADDIIGKQFIEALRERARAGVTIRILLDAVGSFAFSNSPLPASLREEGIEVRFFNPVGLWRTKNISSWFFRDHRKILVVDTLVAFTGGSGIRDDMAEWRDTDVRVTGHVVQEMKYAFDQMWVQSLNTDFFSRIKQAGRAVRGFHFLTNAPYWKKRFLYDNMIEAIRSARVSVYLTTPYFVPDRRLRRVLRLARKRGVDVRILVPKDSNELFVGRASHSYYKELFASGVRIYHYTKEFLHAKTAVIDDEWSTVGSFNLDSLSFLFNYEANIVSLEKHAADSIRTHFLKDVAISEEVDPHVWAQRPLGDKIRELCTIPFRNFL